MNKLRGKSFGAHLDEQVRGFIQDLFGIYKEGGTSTYVGLPECFSGSKMEMLSYIKDRLKASEILSALFKFTSEILSLATNL